MARDVFSSPQVTKAFARAEAQLGGKPFLLADRRALLGVINRIHSGETILPNGVRVKADMVIVATRPQFTPVGGAEKLPEPLDSLTYAEITWRAEYVASDEIHVTLYCCKNP